MKPRLIVGVYPIYLEMRGLWRRHFCSHQALKSPLISAILARFKRLMGAKRASQKLAFPSILGILAIFSFLTVGCGQKGPLYLPAEDNKPKQYTAAKPLTDPPLDEENI